MTLEIYQTSRFKKDIRKLRRQGKDLSRLMTVIELLEQDRTLPVKYRDHPLSGNWINRRECHIQPDWLLIYHIDGNILTLERSGSHSELF